MAITRRAGGLVSCILGVSALMMAAQPPDLRPVTEQDLLEGSKESRSWLMVGGDYNSQRHTQATQITSGNVASLAPQWVFQTDLPGFPGRGFETTPVVVDGVMYITGNNNHAWAIDARTGRQIWHYQRKLPGKSPVRLLKTVNRGFGILGDKLVHGNARCPRCGSRPEDGQGALGFDG